MKKKQSKELESSRYRFALIIIYIIFDYGRPQSIIPIAFLRPQMIIILLLTITLFLDNNYLQYFRRQIKCIFYFILLLILLVPFAKNNYYAFNTAKTMILYTPFIFTMVISIDSIQRLKLIINIMIILMTYIASYSIFNGGVGPGNYFNDENDVSLYINMWLPFSYFLLLQEKSIKKKLLYLFSILIGLVAIIITFSRGGFVGLICMAFIAWLVSPKKKITLVLILICSAFIYYLSSETYLKEMSTITNTSDSTVNERILSWEAGWEMFLDNPLGVGGNNFQVNFPHYQSKEFKRGMYGRVAHSLWFTLIPETGVIGIFIYLFLIFRNFSDSIFIKSNSLGVDEEQKYFNCLSISFIASMVGYFASATFISVLYYAHYWYITGLIFVTHNIFTKSYLIKKEKGIVKSF